MYSAPLQSDMVQYTGVHQIGMLLPNDAAMYHMMLSDRLHVVRVRVPNA